jgi:hypothetical protein
MATQKRIKIIQEFVEKTEKRSREYAAISKQLDMKVTEKKLIELLKPEIAYSNKEVKEDYGHIDSNARLYIQCILTTFEKTEALLDTYYKDCLRYELEDPDLISREIVDAVEELYLNYTRRTERIKPILITLDAKLVREGAHVKVRGKTRRRRRTPSKSGSSSAPPLPNAHKILKNYRKKYNITKPHKKPEKQRYKNTIRNERRIRVGRARPIYHPTVKALKEHRRLRPRSESELDHSSRHSPSPLGNYSPVRPIGAFKIPYEGTKNVEGMKPFGQSGVLPPVRRGTIRRASVHNDDK